MDARKILFSFDEELDDEILAELEEESSDDHDESEENEDEDIYFSHEELDEGLFNL